MDTLELDPRLRHAAGFLGQTPLMLLDGELVSAVSGKTFAVYNPATAAVIANVPEADKKDVDIAVAAARRAFDERRWAKVSPSERGRMLWKLADLIERDLEELAELESIDNGKPYAVARVADLPLAVDMFRYMGGWATKITGTTIPLSLPGEYLSYTVKEPLGVVGQIIPWNFPLLMAAWKIAPALAAGCTVVLKAAEQTPMTALRLAGLIQEAGFPPGVVNILTGFGETAGALLRLSDEADGGTLISLAQDQPATDFALVRDGTPERRRRSPVRRRMLFFSLRASLIVAALLWSIPTAWSGDIRVGFIDPTGPPQFWLPVSAVMQAAAAELGIDVDIRYHERSHDKSIAIAKDFLGERPPPDYLLATNDVGAGGEIIKLADASGVSVILLNNDLDQKDWAEYGEPRTKYRHWLGSLVPDHEGGGYGIAEAILTEAARITNTRPLKILALTGDAETPASVERVRGLKRAIGVMTQILGPNSVDLVDVRYLDWTLKTAEASVREFIKNGGPRIDALWAANDPMAIGAINALREAEYKPGKDVVVGGLNWSQDAIERVLNGEMLLTHGGHFLLGAWAMVIVRDHHDGRDFSEEDVHLQFPMGAIDLPIARHFPQIAKIDWRKVDFTRFSKIRNPALERYSFTPDAVLSQLPSTD